MAEVDKTKEMLGALWDATMPKLYGYLVNVLRDKALAEDILQSTWAKALEASPRCLISTTRSRNGAKPDAIYQSAMTR